MDDRAQMRRLLTMFLVAGGLLALIPLFLWTPSYAEPARDLISRAVAPAAQPAASAALAAPLPAPLPDPYPPTTSNGAAHWAPVAWPSETNWHTYTLDGWKLNDPRTQDPSNGGTAPQNYVNVSSCLPDKASPSVFWEYDAVNKVIFYRSILYTR